jgi:hypothetical protein
VGQGDRLWNHGKQSIPQNAICNGSPWSILVDGWREGSWEIFDASESGTLWSLRRLWELMTWVLSNVDYPDEKSKTLIYTCQA